MVFLLVLLWHIVNNGDNGERIRSRSLVSFSSLHSAITNWVN